MNIFFKGAISIFVLLIASNCSTRKALIFLKSDDLYKVSIIKKVKDFYIVELTRNDSVFTALSFIQEKESGVKIKKGSTYPLVLKKMSPVEKRIAYNGNTGAPYVFGGRKIKRSDRNHWSVYVITNLNGIRLRH